MDARAVRPYMSFKPAKGNGQMEPPFTRFLALLRLVNHPLPSDECYREIENIDNKY